jgi:hypothetical protein
LLLSVTLTSTLTYYEKYGNKLFMILAPGASETSGLYYKTFRIVIYYRKLRSSLERKLRSYDRNPSYV